MKDLVIESKPSIKYTDGWKTLIQGDSTEQLKERQPTVSSVKAGTKGVVVIDSPNIAGFSTGWWFDMAGAEHFNSYLVPEGAEITSDDDVYYEPDVDKAYVEFTFTGNPQQSEYRPQIAISTAIVVAAIAAAIIAVAMAFTLCQIKAYLPSIGEALQYTPAIIVSLGGLFLTVYGMRQRNRLVTFVGVGALGGSGYLAYQKSEKKGT